MAAAIFPVTKGSSEKYSKFLPFSGCLWIFIPGPRRASILFFTISIPVKEYSFSTSAVLKVLASSVPLGRLNAFMPLSSRIPDGPSEQQPQGMPKCASSSDTPPKAAAVPGVTFGLPIPSPRMIQLKSSSLNCATKASMDTLPSFTSIRRYP